MPTKQNFEVVIIGGSYAGLSAAMTLGRSLRSVLVIDSGKPCNRFTPHAHNLITHDGTVPQEIATKAKTQVLAYPTVEFLTDTATGIQGESGDFIIKTSSTPDIKAKKVIFATGVKDLLPETTGLKDCWGKTVLHCPYCHGYEVRGKRTGILINHETAREFYQLISNWTEDLTLFTNGPANFSLEGFSQQNIPVVQKEIKAFVHSDGNLQSLVFVDGTKTALDALYFRPPFEQHCKLPEEIGCQKTESGHLEVSTFQQTSIPGIYAAGDCTTPFRSLSMAISQGNVAAALLNHELIAERYA